MTRTGRDMLRWWLAAAGAAMLGVAVAVVATAGAATPAPVPCSAIGGGKYDCQFYPAGDGISGGAPVQASDGSRIGYLNHGTNWVTCQAVGATVASGAYHNDWWAHTEADDGRWGWVNAVWASGGDNNGAFQSVPGCAASTGLPPGGKAPAPTTSTVAPRPPTTTTTTTTVTTITTTPAPIPAPPPAPTRHKPRLRHFRVEIKVRWHVAARRTRLLAVQFLRLPRRARVRVSCRRRHCGLPQRAMSLRSARRALARAFTGGDVLRLRITAAGYAPEVVELRFRTGRGPAGAVVSR